MNIGDKVKIIEGIHIDKIGIIHEIREGWGISHIVRFSHDKPVISFQEDELELLKEGETND